ncbi:cuticular protein 78E [Haematobia irritans]|uniref:cuticular protein 78E n=1 Tax=Haematobia irritans TaxID=7368 RepID=UPI003F505C18
MKYLCLVLLVGAAFSAPANEVAKNPGNEVVVKKLSSSTTETPKMVEIVESGSEHNMDGSYSFHYRGADGTFREETAVLKNPGTDDQYLEVTGAYSFLDADGKEVVVHYKADNHGFVPVGNNIPEEISKSAKANSELPAMDDNSDEEIKTTATKVKKTRPIEV